MKLYEFHPEDPLCKGEIRHVEGTLRGLGYDGYTVQGVLVTFRPTRLAKAEKSPSPFRAAAFQAQDGTVYETGPFHDVDALPKGVEVSAEGFVDREGRFHTREQATEVMHLDHPVQSEELELKKGEVIAIHPKDILVGRDALFEANSNNVYGKGSFSHGKPIELWKLPDGRHLLTDGHHRLAHHLLTGGANVPLPAVVVGEGYTDYWATPQNPFRYKPTTYGGMEDFYGARGRGQAMSQARARVAAGLKKAEGEEPGQATRRSEFKKIPVERIKLRKSFSEGATNYLGNYSPKKLHAQEIETKLRDHKETLEGMATPGGQHQAFTIAARMAGAPADAELRRKAEEEHGDDVIGVALAAHGLDPHDESLRMSIEAAIQELRLTKSEFNVSVLPRVVMPGQPGADHMAMVIRRAFASNLVYEVRLGGKHSAGTAVAYDREGDRFWLLKPGSGRVSPARGVSDVPYSQSRREAAFAQAARSYESMRDFYPECWLLMVDGKETACMEVMGPGYRPAQKYGDAAELIEPYQDSLDIFRWACLDWVLGNPDRHGGNILVTEDGRVALIDHGSALAGNSFNPPADPNKSFIPYYLRVKYPIDWNEASPAERYRSFPHPTPEERDTLKVWIKGLGTRWESAIEELCAQALPPAKARYDQIVNAEDPVDALLRLWAGLGIEEALEKAEVTLPVKTKPLTEAQIAAWRGALSTGKLKHWLSKKWQAMWKQHDAAGTGAQLGDAFGAELKRYIDITPAHEILRPGVLGKVGENEGLGQSVPEHVADKYIEYLKTPSQANAGVHPHKLAEHMGSEVLSRLPEAKVLEVMRAVQAHPDASGLLSEIFRSKLVERNHRLSKDFARFAVQAPEGYHAFAPHRDKYRQLSNHLTPEEVKTHLMRPGNIRSPQMLWSPQITNEEAANLVHGLDQTRDTLLFEQVAGFDANYPYHEEDWAADDKAPAGRREAIHKALFIHPQTNEHLRWKLARGGTFDMTQEQVKRITDRAPHDAGQIISNQIARNPQRTDLDGIASTHAGNLMDWLGHDPEHSELAQSKRDSAAREQQVHNWLKRLMSDPRHLPDFEDASTRNFWYNYENEVEPHHFATIERYRTKNPDHVRTTFFRGNKVGDSSNYPLVHPSSLANHAHEVQRALLKDPHAVIKDIGGKPHVLVYRGVAGNYAASIMQKDTWDAKTFRFPNAQLSSWTGVPSIAWDFADRDIKNQPKAGLVIRRWMPVEDVIHSGCHLVHKTQRHAHPHEHELVFKHAPEDTHMEVDANDIYVVHFPAGGGKSFVDGKAYHPMHTNTEPMVDSHDGYVEEHGLAGKVKRAYGKIGNHPDLDHEED